MATDYQEIIEQAYRAFNARDIDTALKAMKVDVDWPNGWEGGYVHGHNEVRSYWTRQWAELNPKVWPVGFKDIGDNVVEVEVHQVAKDLNDKVLFDGNVKHIYTFDNGLVSRMEIQK